MRFLYMDQQLPYLLKDAEHPIGGATVQLASWLQGLRNTHHEAGVLTWKGAREYVGRKTDVALIETYGLDEGIRVVRFFTHRYPAMRRAAAEYRPDVIIQACADFQTGVAARIARSLDIPFAYRAANDTDADGRYRAKLPYYARAAYEYGIASADVLLCQNRYQADRFARRYPGKQTVLLENPFAVPENLPPIRPRAERGYVAWIGIFQRQKNLPALLRIVRELPEMEFRIAGKPKPRIDEETEAALQALRGEPNVRFVGYLRRTDVIPFLAQASVLLNTSDYEGFSNTFLEAFSAATPVVLPCRVDPSGIVETYGLGCSVPNSRDLSWAIRDLVHDSDYDITAGRCREYVRRKHDPSLLATRLAGTIAGLSRAAAAQTAGEAAGSS